MSTSAVPVVPPQAPPVVQDLRPGRALVGWMNPSQAYGFIQRGLAPAAAAEAVERARQAVAARAAGVEQSALVGTGPAELAAHLSALEASPAARPMYDEGWRVALVDLSRVCAFQPSVITDQSIARVRSAIETDPVSLAAVTLPLTQGDALPVQYDPIHRAWTVSSTNPNVRIAAEVGPLPVSPAGIALGFAVTAGPSFMQVGRYRGRYYLRDGYHRAFGLLSRGITTVPAFTREISVFEELVPDPRTMLPQDGYLGDRPPVLADYLDDQVSAAVQLPSARKMVLVQAMELTLAG
jgi:hypothetical protein